MTRHPDQGPSGGLAPQLQIGGSGAAVAIDFYTAAFGATEKRRLPADDGKRLLHAHLHINGASLMLHDEFPEYVDPASADSGPPAGVTLHLQVDDAAAWFARALAAGATATMPLQAMFWGDLYGQLIDPFGHRWSIGQALPAQD
jgi:PhnB protein